MKCADDIVLACLQRGQVARAESAGTLHDYRQAVDHPLDGVGLDQLRDVIAILVARNLAVAARNLELATFQVSNASAASAMRRIGDEIDYWRSISGVEAQP